MSVLDGNPTVSIGGRTYHLIGTYSAERPACSGTGHLVGCYNPWLDETACVCGRHWWTGRHGSWHARYLYAHGGQGAPVLGYDVYLMSAAVDGETA